MNKDHLTTALGMIAAGATAAQPIVNGVQGTFHQQDYFALFTAIAMAVWGFFTNKGQPNG